jgi:hypothetical protein
MLAFGCAKPERAAEETKAEFKSVLEKLNEGTMEFTLTLGVDAERVYNTAKTIAPELEELEGKPDSALALLELYEQYYEELKNYDFASMTQRMKRGVEDPAEYTWRYEDEEGYRMWKTREDIEGLLSQEVFFEKLDHGQRERFCKAMSGIYGVISPAMMETFGYGVRPAFFEMGGEKLMDDFVLTVTESGVSYSASAD